LFSEWIEMINASGARIVAVDVPSGLDSNSGVAYAPAVRADLTVTLGLPKPGLTEADGPRLCGDVWVVDIGVPFEAYAELGLQVPRDLFAESDRVRLGVGR
jgi:NAD(P)H-hydrate epimerase